MVKIAVLTSGGGTNLEAILCAEEAGKIRSGKVFFKESRKSWKESHPS